MNSYTLPEGNVQIAFSGGRTSAYMLHQILEANGDLPDRVQVCFANTGREMPQTLDFVQECATRWGVHVNWIEYQSDTHGFKTVSHNSASREGEPFEKLILKKKGIPNQLVRFCTIELKIRAVKKFLMTLGWKEWTNAVGIRADEQRRIRPEDDKMKDRWYTWQPLNHAGVSKHDVALFWRRQDFDLTLPNIKGTTPLGNCDGCFLKSEKNRAALAREYPDRFAWWARMEDLGTELRKKNTQQSFIDHQTYRELASFVDRQGDWIFDDENGVLCQADDGECTG